MGWPWAVRVGGGWGSRGWGSMGWGSGGGAVGVEQHGGGAAWEWAWGSVGQHMGWVGGIWDGACSIGVGWGSMSERSGVQHNPKCI